MVKKMGMNVVILFCCAVSLLAVAAINYPPLAGAQGVDSYTKLMLHADGSDQGTSFTDSSSGAKTVTNNESYDSYTKLMLHMEGSGNSFTDSAASKAVTTNGDVSQTTAQFKFSSKSGVFDGTGDYLSLADSDDWNFGSGDFTIDGWVRLNSLAAVNSIVSQFVSGGNDWILYTQGDGSVRFYAGGAVIVDMTSASLEVTINTWYHLAVTRSGNNWKLFKNGVQIASSGATGTIPDYASPLLIGAYNPPAYFFDGSLDEFRISKGIARWTSDFTPPSSPYGKVATVTSQKKFGTASGEFHGSGDYLSLADSDDWNFGSGDFTIDFWVRFNVVPAVAAGMWEQLHLNSAYGGHSFWFTNVAGHQWRWRVLTPSGTTLLEVVKDTTIVVNTWYHMACVRTGNTWKIFQDGTQLGTDVITSIAIPDFTGLTYIGTYDTTTYPHNGWLDELRISKGIARWTSNFTPPSAPYEVDTTSPTVSSTSPSSSATGVGVSGAISATFSEDMDSSTITTSTFTLSSSSGSSVSGTVSYSNKVATFTPSSNLSYSTTYTATITTGVKDSGGNAMSSTYTWSFTTSSAPDTTAPTGSVSGASYTNSSTVTLTLTATDSVGVTGYYLSDSSTTPSASASGWTSVTLSTSYSGSVSYSLSGGEGSKTIYDSVE